MQKRKLKVYGMSGYKYKPTPTIILRGKWLDLAGFSIGDHVSVSFEDGKLIIISDAERKKTQESD